MKECPFNGKECGDYCQLFAPVIQNCCLVALTMLNEDMQKVSVLAYDRYLKEE